MTLRVYVQNPGGGELDLQVQPEHDPRTYSAFLKADQFAIVLDHGVWIRIVSMDDPGGENGHPPKETVE